MMDQADVLVLTESDIALFWSKVTKGTGCWLWGGGQGNGYGLFDRRRGGVRRAWRAHRLSWELTHGYVPPTMLRHSCDTPLCVRPSHLLTGTAKQNSQDMVCRHRHWVWTRPERIPRGATHWTSIRGTTSLPRGAAHGSAVLSEGQVVQIRLMYAAGGVTHVALASRFGVSKPLIGKIVRREVWAHVR